MVKTRDDVKDVSRIIDNFERLGVPPAICRDLRIWLNKEASKIIKKEVEL